MYFQKHVLSIYYHYQRIEVSKLQKYQQDEEIQTTIMVKYNTGKNKTDHNLIIDSHSFMFSKNKLYTYFL